LSGALSAAVDLRSSLRRVHDVGVAVVVGALVPSALGALLGELGTLPFSEPPGDALPSTTGCELAVLTGELGPQPAMRRVRDDLAERVRRDGAGIGSMSEWWPDEIFVRRYSPGSTGMAPHRDGVRFRHLVATVTVAGTATFVWCDDDEHVVERWVVGPGDVVLLRGSGPGDATDRRPRHAVGPPGTAGRCSVAFRMCESFPNGAVQRSYRVRA
jgi:hypothetical protein